MKVSNKSSERSLEIQRQQIKGLITDPQHTPIEEGLISTGTAGVWINPHADTEELLDLPCIQINREYRRRVNKMVRHFRKDLKDQKLFVVFRVTEHLSFEYHGESIDVEPGLYVANGNTRCESMRLGKISIPTSVVLMVYDIDDEQSYMNEYFAIDNEAATEKSADKIRGALKFLGMPLSSRKGSAGGFGSALNNAYPLDPKDTALEKVAYFRDEILMLDQAGIFNPTEKGLAKQHFYGACLLGAKLYGKPAVTALKYSQTLTQLSRLDFESLETNKAKWNGVTAIIYETVFNGRKNWVPEEFMGSTKFASVEPVFDFYLYCLEMAMTDKLLDNKKGFKPSNWKGYYEDAMAELREDGDEE